MRRLINAGKNGAIAFVGGTTEAINLLAYAWTGKQLAPGYEIVIIQEQHANIVPWQLLSQQMDTHRRRPVAVPESPIAARTLVAPRQICSG